MHEMQMKMNTNDVAVEVEMADECQVWERPAFKESIPTATTRGAPAGFSHAANDRAAARLWQTDTSKANNHVTKPAVLTRQLSGALRSAVRAKRILAVGLAGAMIFLGLSIGATTGLTLYVVDKEKDTSMDRNTAILTQKGGDSIVMTATAKAHVPLIAAPLLSARVLDEIEHVRVTRPAYCPMNANMSSGEGSTIQERITELYHVTGYTKRSNLSMTLHTSRGDKIELEQGKAWLLQDEERIPVCYADVSCALVKVGDVPIHELELSARRQLSMLLPMSASKRFVKGHPDGRRELFISGFVDAVSDAAGAVVDAVEDVAECPLCVLEKACHLAADMITDLVETIVDAIKDALMAPLVEAAEGICNKITRMINEGIAQGHLDVCVSPDFPCDLGLINQGEKVVDALSLTKEDGTKRLEVKMEANLTVCAKLKKLTVNCQNIKGYLKTKVDDWVSETVLQPIENAKNAICGGRRRSLKDESTSVIHGVALGALAAVSGGDHRRLEAHLSQLSVQEAQDYNQALIPKAVLRAQEMIQERLVKETIEEIENRRRRLSSAAPAPPALKSQDLVTMDQAVFEYEFNTALKVTATASEAMDERRETDLLATAKKGKPFGAEFDVNLAILPGLLSVGFTAGFDVQMPTVVHGTFQTAMTATSHSKWHKVYEVTVGGGHSSPRHRDVTPRDGGLQLELDRTNAHATASLSVSLGMHVGVNLRLELVLASVLKLFAEASMKWEAMMGADAVACVGTANHDFLCERFHTRLTPYVEYEEKDAICHAPANGKAELGLWAYVVYPQISLRAGVVFPGSDLIQGCVETGFGWDSSFGPRNLNDGLGGQEHPYGGYIKRFAKVWHAQLPSSGAVIVGEHSHQDVCLHPPPPPPPAPPPAPPPPLPPPPPLGPLGPNCGPAFGLVRHAASCAACGTTKFWCNGDCQFLNYPRGDSNCVSKASLTFLWRCDSWCEAHPRPWNEKCTWSTNACALCSACTG